ncbi:GLT1D1 [Cordylochernes scorpioides]|uniref:GLT1D1 n=1 Tax=Cordylochernes scorpioides TaxID=51811 RepID=A0ABY6LAA6_9ARAC|nr:GLT1D1 [Cordylochernes scorpioides]
MALNVVQTMVCILFISPGSGSDGNSTTISRIYQHLHTHAACRTVSHKISIQEFLKEASWSDVIIALHAWHSSDLLLTSHRRPYILIFGGTDLNHYSNSKPHLDQMTQVVKNSKYLVAFSATMSSIAQQLWPDIPDSRIIIIPQAIITKPNPICIFQNNLDTSKVVLLLAGIRKVKDPLFLVEAFSKWHHNNPEYKFVIMGPCKDQEFCKKVEKKRFKTYRVLSAMVQYLLKMLMDSFKKVS